MLDAERRYLAILSCSTVPIFHVSSPAQGKGGVRSYWQRDHCSSGTRTLKDERRLV
jgi:hypothetical protein